MLPADRLPFVWRVGNAMVSYVAYLGDMFYPVGLAAFYPHQGGNLPPWQMIAAALVLIAVTAIALVWRHRHPYLLFGWLWYLGMLVPVIGLVQVGTQARADRYTYLTQIGMYVALAWAVEAAARRMGEGDGPVLVDQRRPSIDGARSVPAKIGTVPVGRYRACVCTGAGLMLLLLMGCAWRQTSFWRDGVTLWAHSLACAPRNALAYNNFGNSLTAEARDREGHRRVPKGPGNQP